MPQTLSKMQSHEKSPSKIDFQKIQNAKTQIFSEMKKIFGQFFSPNSCINVQVRP